MIVNLTLLLVSLKYKHPTVLPLGLVIKQRGKPTPSPPLSPLLSPCTDSYYLPCELRTEAMSGPRFEQTSEQFQPRPMAAIELIKEEPIRLIQERVAACDGGKLHILTVCVRKGADMM